MTEQSLFMVKEIRIVDLFFIRVMLPALLILHFLSSSVLCLQFDLDDGWDLQSSDKISQTGSVISTTGYEPQDWYPVSVPSTVLAGLVANDVYPDPFYSTNFSAIPPGQFDDSWWYRTEFTIPESESGKRIWLHFSGVNYRANIWLNGERIAGSTEVVGAYRTYAFDMTNVATTGAGGNVLAVEVFRQEQYDLGINFVDWAPHPPDESLGLFRKVYVKTTGTVSIQHPHVVTGLDIPSLSTARLKVLAVVTNATGASVTGTLEGSIRNITFSREVTLGARETREVAFLPAEFPQLTINNPQVWWPWQMGDQPMYPLKLAFVINNTISDSARIEFGIRQVSSRLVPANDPEYRLFSVNGKDILIRGAGWCPDLFLQSDPKRLEAQVKYVRDMHLNTIRLEGKFEVDDFYTLCDKYGILALPGWCCSAFGTGWEEWSRWDDEDYAVAYASMRSQIYRHRHHPCMLAWMNGSDNIPPRDVEQSYLDILEELSWQNPSMASATHRYTSSITGIPGGKMTGPYKWEPPAYWFQDSYHGGYFGFNTETGPGAAVPPLESIQEFIPANNQWPIDNVWDFHCGQGSFANLDLFTNALDRRYGSSRSAREYCMKAQVAAYESHRAMFEAYSQNRYTSTGIIQWMLNNAWPSMIWHLYDYYLRPGGSYFGAKTACRPLHIQYSVNDRMVTVVNSYYSNFTNLSAEAWVYTIDGEERFHNQEDVSLGPDEVKKLFAVPRISGISSTYFLRLNLAYENGEACDCNSYWLSTDDDVLNWQNSSWHSTPLSSYGDLTALQGLDTIELNYSYTVRNGIHEDTAYVTVENRTSTVAFSVIVRLLKNSDKKEILPVIWSDNYFILYPGEERKIVARYKGEDAGSGTPGCSIGGWNVKQGISPVNPNSAIPQFALPHKYAFTIYNLQGRKVFEKVSGNHIQQALSAFRSHNTGFWQPDLAVGIYLIQMEQFYKNGERSINATKVMMGF